jgi:hypothetical protein
MSNKTPNPHVLGIKINRPGKFKDQRWLTAHNAWNTEDNPANQCKTITELLDYGIRGFALDIYGDDEDSLHLQHGHGNVISSIKWKVIRDELKAWMNKNRDQVVTLFFESYLTGPKPGDSVTQQSKTALGSLDKSLKAIASYKPGRHVQEDAINTKDISALIGNGTGTKTQRLFAFIEKEPDEGAQTLFPVMTTIFAENDYGNVATNPDTWTNLRSGSSKSNPIGFLNHFGSAPTGSEWERNAPKTILHHVNDFRTAYNKYPSFISLDYINWGDDNNGPIEVLKLF